MTGKLDDDAQAMAFASWLLTSAMVRQLAEKGTLRRSDAGQIVAGSLLFLERQEEITEPAIHQARGILSGLATEIGIALRSPS